MELEKVSAYSIKYTSLLCLFVFFAILPTLARSEIIVNPDGSAYLEELIPDSNNVNDNIIVRPNELLVIEDTITINFNDLNNDEFVTLNRYIDFGLQINTGPSSTMSGHVFSSIID